MAYIYQVTFRIRKDQMNQLQVGAALERALSYLKALLPNRTGFMEARAMYSLSRAEEYHLCFQSMWDHWEDIEAYSQSNLAAQKILTEFEPHVALQDLVIDVYTEVD